MRIISDFHIHSKYSRAASSDMDLPTISQWAKYKGVQLIGSGDFTHPFWLQELKKYLRPAGDGFYEYNGVNYFLTTELCCIYSKNGKTRRIHNLLFAPDFDTAEKINRRLSMYGNLLGEGLPVLSLDCEDLVKAVLDISDRCMIIPAHAWAQNFSVFGANAGFNRLIDCFPSQLRNIHAIETGASSGPEMSWRVSFLDITALLSNSDAHSPSDIGREANVFDLKDYTDIYNEVTEIIQSKDSSHFLYTIECFPQEGKYHYDGHRNCGISVHPKDTIASNNICPGCHKPLSTGVLHRIEKLADRETGYVPLNSTPFKRVVPLEGIIADALDLNRGSAAVRKEYLGLVGMLGPELSILLDLAENELNRSRNKKIVESIMRIRRGDVDIIPGYDGIYGSVKVKSSETIAAAHESNILEQLSLL